MNRPFARIAAILAAAVCCTAGRTVAEVAPETSVDHRGLLSFAGNISTNLITFGSGWNYAAQDYCLKGVKQSGKGSSLRYEADFAAPGVTLRMLETLDPATNDKGQKGLKVGYTLSNAAPFSLDNAYLAFRLPVADFAGGRITVDDKEFTLPQTFEKEYLPIPRGASKIAVANGKVSLEIRGNNLAAAYVDMRKQKGNGYEIRLEFGNLKNTKSASLSFEVFSAGTPFLISANKDWIELPVARDIQEGGILDFSFMADAPAGKYGRIIPGGDGHFAYEKKTGVRPKLVGTNLCFSANYLSKEAADNLARTFRLMGYNTIRFHHTDVDLINGNWNARRSDDINLAQQDKLDYLFAAMKKNGMYVVIDLYTMRRFGADEIEGWNKYVDNPNVIKALVPLLPGAFNAWTKMALKWLNHTNPYTGIAMKDDPALLTICPVNEDSIASVWAATPETKQLYLDRFEKWKKETGRSGNNDALFAQFLTELKAASNRQMAAFFTSNGINAMITGGNWWDTMAQTFERAELDVVDNHHYWDHPQPTYNQNSDMKSSLAYISPVFMAPTRIFGKPFTVSEYNFCAPNQFRAEGGAMFGAYAALQDWDGAYRFAWAHSDKNVTGQNPVEGFDTATDPLNQLTERQIILLFGRGDVAPAAKKYVYAVTMAEATKGGLGDMWAKGLFPQPFIATALVSQIGSQVTDGRSIQGRFDGVVAAAAPAPEVLSGNPFVGIKNLPKLSGSGDEIVSDNGQVILNNKKGYVKVVTDKTECLVAPAAIDLAGKMLAVKNRSTFSSVSASAMDGKPLAESRRVLFFHLTNVFNTNMQFTNPKMTTLAKRGTLPYLVRAGAADVSLKNGNPGLKLYAVDFGGKRLREEKAEYVDGAYCFKAEVSAAAGQPVLIYELAGN